MIELGNYNTLTILRSTRVGLFLGDEEVDDLLLPNKYIPETFNIGDSIEVFCYLDHEERPVATTLKPYITRNTAAFLEVVDLNEFGAFLDWGLEKHLFVPFREQLEPMVKGKRYVVYCYLDPKSFRLTASSRLDRFLKASGEGLEMGEEVALLVYRETELGFEVVINNTQLGLVFKNQVFQALKVGDSLPGYIKHIRADGKIDVVLRPQGYRSLEPAANTIYEALQAAGGTLPLHDKASPEAIKSQLGMSKKMFKKGVGALYRERKIELGDNFIKLL
ncbi:CvfB family protein [Robiginitalea sp. IMCC43444]|uniref:CvfB family protein n=1 Tax=Robiginitalea sp. IMCC43444 TaxID=3459121 RepID=UPI004042BBBE